ncbi:MAG: NAD-dependent epimerase/dehydratase family protein, partial [Desulfuromonadales bacterium]
MEKNSKIFITGAQGMVGSAIVRRLLDGGYTNLITPDRKQLDLLDQQAVTDFFSDESPDYVFMAAAKVGGIHANSTYPAEFIHENLVIQSNVIEQAYRHHVKRLLFLGSSCIYP